jgi:hypothetical protein
VIKLPADSEIRQAIEALFKATAGIDRIKRWNALVPTDDEFAVGLPLGHKHVTNVPRCEFKEITDLVLFLDELNQKPKRSQFDSVRLMIAAYCHIMESDLAPTVIWNQLRLLDGQDPSWRFTRTTKKGDAVVCEYPREKFREIETLATRVKEPIGDVITQIWDAGLRNAFSHSQYFLTPQYLIPTKTLSPISRRNTAKGWIRSPRSYSFEEISERYRAAKSFLLAVAREHSQACKTFK